MFNLKKTALVFGVLFAASYLLWALALLVGGQGFLDFVIGLHLLGITVTSQVTLGKAVIGLIYHFVMGLVFGFVLAWLWNKLGEE